MSPRNSSSGSDHPLDIYVGLMFVSVAALILGCSFLAMELGQYDWAMSN